MDFHSMNRRELQALCKKHKLPANLTNAEMTNKLSSLLKAVEGPVTRSRTGFRCVDNAMPENDPGVDKIQPKKVRFQVDKEMIQSTDLRSHIKGKTRTAQKRSRMMSLEKRGDKSVVEKGSDTKLSIEFAGSPGRATRSRSKKLPKGGLVSEPDLPNKKKGGAKRVAPDVSDVEHAKETMVKPIRVTRSRVLALVDGGLIPVLSPAIEKRLSRGVVKGNIDGNLSEEKMFPGTRIDRSKHLQTNRNSAVITTQNVQAEKKRRRGIANDTSGAIFSEKIDSSVRVTRSMVRVLEGDDVILVSKPLVEKKRTRRKIVDVDENVNPPEVGSATAGVKEVVTRRSMRNKGVGNKDKENVDKTKTRSQTSRREMSLDQVSVNETATSYAQTSRRVTRSNSNSAKVECNESLSGYLFAADSRTDKGVMRTKRNRDEIESNTYSAGKLIKTEMVGKQRITRSRAESAVEILKEVSETIDDDLSYGKAVGKAKLTTQVEAPSMDKGDSQAKVNARKRIGKQKTETVDAEVAHLLELPLKRITRSGGTKSKSKGPPDLSTVENKGNFEESTPVQQKKKSIVKEEVIEKTRTRVEKSYQSSTPSKTSVQKFYGRFNLSYSKSNRTEEKSSRRFTRSSAKSKQKAPALTEHNDLVEKRRKQLEEKAVERYSSATKTSSRGPLRSASNSKINKASNLQVKRSLQRKQRVVRETPTAVASSRSISTIKGATNADSQFSTSKGAGNAVNLFLESEIVQHSSSNNNMSGEKSRVTRQYVSEDVHAATLSLIETKAQAGRLQMDGVEEVEIRADQPVILQENVEMSLGFDSENVLLDHDAEVRGHIQSNSLSKDEDMESGKDLSTTKCMQTAVEVGDLAETERTVVREQTSMVFGIAETSAHDSITDHDLGITCTNGDLNEIFEDVFADTGRISTDDPFEGDIIDSANDNGADVTVKCMEAAEPREHLSSSRLQNIELQISLTNADLVNKEAPSNHLTGLSDVKGMGDEVELNLDKTGSSNMVNLQKGSTDIVTDRDLGSRSVREGNLNNDDFARTELEELPSRICDEEVAGNIYGTNFFPPVDELGTYGLENTVEFSVDDHPKEFENTCDVIEEFSAPVFPGRESSATKILEGGTIKDYRDFESSVVDHASNTQQLGSFVPACKNDAKSVDKDEVSHSGVAEISEEVFFGCEDPVADTGVNNEKQLLEDMKTMKTEIQNCRTNSIPAFDQTVATVCVENVCMPGITPHDIFDVGCQGSSRTTLYGSSDGDGRRSTTLVEDTETEDIPQIHIADQEERKEECEYESINRGKSEGMALAKENEHKECLDSCNQQPIISEGKTDGIFVGDHVPQNQFTVPLVDAANPFKNGGTSPNLRVEDMEISTEKAVSHLTDETVEANRSENDKSIDEEDSLPMTSVDLSCGVCGENRLEIACENVSASTSNVRRLDEEETFTKETGVMDNAMKGIMGTDFDNQEQSLEQVQANDTEELNILFSAYSNPEHAEPVTEFIPSPHIQSSLPNRDRCELDGCGLGNLRTDTSINDGNDAVGMEESDTLSENPYNRPSFQLEAQYVQFDFDHNQNPDEAEVEQGPKGEVGPVLAENIAMARIHEEREEEAQPDEAVSKENSTHDNTPKVVSSASDRGN